MQEEERGRTKVLVSAASSSVVTLIRTSIAQEEQQNTPRKKRRTKAEMKEELMQQKVSFPGYMVPTVFGFVEHSGDTFLSSSMKCHSFIIIAA